MQSLEETTEECLDTNLRGDELEEFGIPNILEFL